MDTACQKIFDGALDKVVKRQLLDERKRHDCLMVDFTTIMRAPFVHIDVNSSDLSMLKVEVVDWIPLSAMVRIKEGMAFFLENLPLDGRFMTVMRLVFPSVGFHLFVEIAGKVGIPTLKGTDLGPIWITGGEQHSSVFL